jgi:hypothetical protein
METTGSVRQLPFAHISASSAAAGPPWATSSRMGPRARPVGSIGGTFTCRPPGKVVVSLAIGYNLGSVHGAEGMGEAERVSELIGDIYDASLDPALWPLVLENSGNFVGGVASALFMKDVVRKAHNTVYTWGYDPNYVQVYVEKFIQFDPFTTGQFFFAIEEPLSVADLMSHEEHRKSRFFKEWVQPQGWIDARSATLEKSATTYSGFSVIRHERTDVIDKSFFRDRRSGWDEFSACFR